MLHEKHIVCTGSWPIVLEPTRELCIVSDSLCSLGLLLFMLFWFLHLVMVEEI